MKLECNKQALQAVVKRTLPFVERKSTIPIISTIHIKADKPLITPLITFTVTNLDQSLIVILDEKITVHEPGMVCVPARQLANVLDKLKTIDATQVHVSADKENWVTITCGDLTVKIPGTVPEDYPTLEPMPSDGRLGSYPADVLLGLIERTEWAIGPEESRFTLNGALLELRRTGTDDSIRMVATDGHRCAIAEYALVPECATSHKCLLPRDAIHKLSGELEHTKGFVEMEIGPDRVWFSSGDWQMCTRLLTEQFPNYQATIPKMGQVNKRVILPVSKALAVVRTVLQFANERSHATRWEYVPVGGKKMGVMVSASNTETGQASQLIPCNCEDTVTIGFDGTYVLDVLQSAYKQNKEAQVVLCLRDEESASVWMPLDENGSSGAWKSQCVLMPMRI